jgi:hypothetical protein
MRKKNTGKKALKKKAAKPATKKPARKKAAKKAAAVSAASRAYCNDHNTYLTPWTTDAAARAAIRSHEQNFPDHACIVLKK